MSKYIRRHRILVIAVCLLLVITAGFLIYTKDRTEIIDSDELYGLASDIRAAAESGNFPDQESLRSYITGWADSQDLDYKVDGSYNIIFNTPANERKKKESPTVVCLSYNYETAASCSELLAAASLMARSDISSGRRTVIFFNDEGNEGSGFISVSKKYFKGKSKVIYMDEGSSPYMSRSSFARTSSSIIIPAEKEAVKCDSAVKIHISGIPSGEIGSDIELHPDPVSAFGNLLSRLKARSTVFQIADFTIGSNGNMYPVSADAVILMNSYNIPAFTKYIDNSIRQLGKQYGDNYPDFEYSYEILDDISALPDSAYSAETAERLTNVLYTVQLGVYQYNKGDDIPEERSDDLLMGINAATGLYAGDDSIRLGLLTQAYDDKGTEHILNDNKAAAELFGCSLKVSDNIPAFRNEKDALSHTLHNTFGKAGNDRSTSSDIDDASDDAFTPCSYLAGKNSKADIVHICIDKNKAASLANAIMLYIETKGNLLSL